MRATRNLKKLISKRSGCPGMSSSETSREYLKGSKSHALSQEKVLVPKIEKIKDKSKIRALL